MIYASSWEVYGSSLVDNMHQKSEHSCQSASKVMAKVMIHVKCASKEISKHFSKSKILIMAWNPYISTET